MYITDFTDDSVGRKLIVFYLSKNFLLLSTGLKNCHFCFQNPILLGTPYLYGDVHIPVFGHNFSFVNLVFQTLMGGGEGGGEEH